MGASPWTSSPQLSFTPEETKGASIHSAPLGLRTWRLPRFHGLTHYHEAHAHGYNMPSRWDFRRFPIDKNAPRTRIATFSILTWRLPILYLLPKS